jgi:hypothetical protein
MESYVVRIEEGISALRMLIGKLTGKRPFGRPRRRWEDNIEMEDNVSCQYEELD